ncbi:MAG: hypothetical protein ACJ73E_15435 [Mycobacteriales bacterium]
MPWETWLWLAVLAGGPDAVLAGPTAAGLGGLRGYEEDRIHLLVPPGRQVTALALICSAGPDRGAAAVPGSTGRGGHRPGAGAPVRGAPGGARAGGVVVHRSGRLPPQDVHQSLAPRRTGIARSVVDTASWARDERTSCAVVAAAVQQRLVRPAQLREVLERLPTARRRKVLLQTLGDVAAGSQSIAELDLARLCRRAGLPLPARQAARTDGAGRRRWLDAWWPEWHLQVEVDGAAHTEVGAWWADMRRQNEAWIRGERVLRFPAVVLRREPAAVVEQLRTALAVAGWPGHAAGSCGLVS